MGQNGATCRIDKHFDSKLWSKSLPRFSFTFQFGPENRTNSTGQGEDVGGGGGPVSVLMHDG